MNLFVELRRKYENDFVSSPSSQNNNIGINVQPEPMLSSDCSEDTESDSTSTCSSSSVNEYSAPCSPLSTFVEPAADRVLENGTESPNENDRMLLSGHENSEQGEIDGNHSYNRHNGMNGHGPPGHEPPN